MIPTSLVYALGRDNDKQSKARHILEATPIASSQVINETVAVLTDKQRFTREEAYEVVDALMIHPCQSTAAAR